MRNEKETRDTLERAGRGRRKRNEEGGGGGIKGMDGWKCGIHLCIRGRNFEHSIVCFRKIRDGTAKASRAQFTLLNRRNGFEHRLFPRYSAFKFSFRAVLLSFSSLSLSSFLFNPYSTHACVSTSIFSLAHFDSRIFTWRILIGFLLIRWPRFLPRLPRANLLEFEIIIAYSKNLVRERWTSTVQI